MEKHKVLITTAIDYCNDVIHIGHAYQKILADSLARHHRRLLGNDNVFFTVGTDEYGTTNLKAAETANRTPQEHVNVISQEDKQQYDALHISYDRFIRTTDPDHAQFAQEFFRKAQENGDVYKGTYIGFYCEGCEAYKTHSELDENDQCPLHTTRQIQKLEEENYFFAWSKYANFLYDLLETKHLLIPDARKKDMLGFLAQELQDKPISRPISKVAWGIPIPGDDQHVLYVWFDALVNYYTAAQPRGFWSEDTHIIHILGKDNAVFHALLWPAMLQSVGYHQPDTVYAHGFMNLDGHKISKSRGNIIRPDELVQKYGVDAVRYYFLKNGPITEDVNISITHFEEVYTADLANGLGNLVSRVAKMLEKSGYTTTHTDYSTYPQTDKMQARWSEYRVDQVLLLIWDKIRDLDKYIDEAKPWELLKSENVLSDDNRAVWQKLITETRDISILLEPFMPTTAKKIKEQFAGTQVYSEDGLFPRLP